MELDEQIIQKYKGEAISAEAEIALKVKEAIEEEEYSKRRWFWELMQNAIDTISNEPDDRKIELSLIISETKSVKTVSFSHNGGNFKKAKELFRFDDFKNLINPVSGKSEEDPNTIGKFGTGFLSTHILSLKVKIEGKFEKVESTPPINISSVIDRTKFLEGTQEARDKRIRSIIKSLAELDKSSDLQNKEEFPSAKFTYYLNYPCITKLKDELEIVNEGLNEIDKSIGFVLSFNKKVEKITIKNEIKDSKIVYTMNYNLPNNIGAIKNQLVKNKKHFKYVIVSTKDDVSIAWQIDCKNNFLNLRDENQWNLCNLYCTFPLLGSEDFRFPFIIHSKNFAPNEKRNGIKLINEKDENCLKIKKAIDIYKQFIENNCEKLGAGYNVIETGNLNQKIKWINSEWLSQVTKSLRNIILKAKLVTVEGILTGKQSILDNEGNLQIVFPYQSKDGVFDNGLNFEFYDLCLPLYKHQLPCKSELNFWIKKLWFEDKIKRIKLEDILEKITLFSDLDTLKANFNFEEKIEEKEKERIVKKWLSNLYVFIFKIGKKKLLDYYNPKNNNTGIILTRGRKFKKFSSCKKDIGFDNSLIDEDILNMHSEICDNNQKDFLIESTFKDLVNEAHSELKEETLASEIRNKVQDDLIKEHDKLVNRKNNGEQLTDLENKRIIEIESQLSKLQVWISKYNADREYFSDFFKRKLLYAIIDEEKNVSLMDLIELDKAKIISLKEQSEILKDEDLKEKLELGEIILRIKRGKQKKDQQNRIIGDNFENLFKQLLDTENIQYHHKDGEQDFIIYPNSPNQFYVELKSISINSNFVDLTPKQCDKSIKESDRYFVCVIPHSGNIESFDLTQFKNNCQFSNSLSYILNKKLHQLKEFKLEEEAAKGVLPIEEVLKKLNEKEYKISIDYNKWCNISWKEFIQTIKSKSQTFHTQILN